MLKKPKIVLSINSLQGGGAEKFVLTIGQAFYQLGFEVHVLRFHELVEHQLNENLYYHLIEYNKYRWLPKGKVRNWFFARKVDAYIKNNVGSPAFIMANLERANTVFQYSKLSNIVNVVHSTLSLQYEFNQIQNLDSFVNLLKDRFSKHPCICVSKGVEADFIKYLGNITRINTIYNPVDMENIINQSGEYDPEYKQYMLHIGSFKKAKDHETLIRAYSQSKQLIPLLLAGKGNLKNEVEKLIQELALENKIIFLGFCKNPYPYLKHASFKVLSSNREGFPMVIEEALALNTPVISTDCQSGPNEVLPPNNLVPVGDTNQLADKMNQAMEDPQQFQVDFNEGFLPEKVAKQYLEFMDVDLPQ